MCTRSSSDCAIELSHSGGNLDGIPKYDATSMKLAQYCKLLDSWINIADSQADEARRIAYFKYSMHNNQLTSNLMDSIVATTYTSYISQLSCLVDGTSLHNLSATATRLVSARQNGRCMRDYFQEFVAYKAQLIKKSSTDLSERFLCLLFIAGLDNPDVQRLVNSQLCENFNQQSCTKLEMIYTTIQSIAQSTHTAIEPIPATLNTAQQYECENDRGASYIRSVKHRSSTSSKRKTCTVGKQKKFLPTGIIPAEVHISIDSDLPKGSIPVEVKLETDKYLPRGYIPVEVENTKCLPRGNIPVELKAGHSTHLPIDYIPVKVCHKNRTVLDVNRPRAASIKSPKVRIGIGDQKISAIVDTGCEGSIISKQMFMELQKAAGWKKYTSRTVFRAFDRSETSSEGTFELALNVNGTKARIQCEISEGACGLLLGTNFISKFPLTIKPDYYGRQLVIEFCNSPHQVDIYVGNTVVVPARSVQLVRTAFNSEIRLNNSVPYLIPAAGFGNFGVPI